MRRGEATTANDDHPIWDARTRADHGSVDAPKKLKQYRIEVEEKEGGPAGHGTGSIRVLTEITDKHNVLPRHDSGSSLLTTPPVSHSTNSSWFW